MTKSLLVVIALASVLALTAAMPIVSDAHKYGGWGVTYGYPSYGWGYSSYGWPHGYGGYYTVRPGGKYKYGGVYGSYGWGYPAGTYYRWGW